MPKTTVASGAPNAGGVLNACLVKKDPASILAEKDEIEKLIGFPFLFFKSDGKRVTGEFQDPARPDTQIVGYYRGKQHHIPVEKSIELFERFGGSYSIHERRFVFPCGNSAPYRQGKKNGVPCILNTVFSDEHLGEMKYLQAVKAGTITLPALIKRAMKKAAKHAVVSPAGAPPAPVAMPTMPRAKPASKSKAAATKKAWIALAGGA